MSNHEWVDIVKYDLWLPYSPADAREKIQQIINQCETEWSRKATIHTNCASAFESPEQNIAMTPEEEGAALKKVRMMLDSGEIHWDHDISVLERRVAINERYASVIFPQDYEAHVQALLLLTKIFAK